MIGLGKVEDLSKVLAIGMKNDIWGLVVSMLYVSIFFCVLRILQNINVLREMYARKILHIAMANWWWIRIGIFQNPKLAVMGPLLFTIINFAREWSKHDSKYGMTQFAFSLSCLVAYSAYSDACMVKATVAIMILGLADPLAAIVGSVFNPHTKTLEGSITFAIITYIVLLCGESLGFLIIGQVHMICISFALSLVEKYFLPKLDNLMIPLSTIILLSL